MFMDPASLMASCNLQATDSVADFGAGSGFVARAAAACVPSGTVFAVEINRDIVARLGHEATEMHIKNLHPIWGDIEIAGGSKLGDRSMDMVIISNTLFHIEDKEGCFKEALRVLKPGGRLLVVDWTESFGGLGPRPQSVVSKDFVRELSKRLGFEYLTDALQAGDHHYAILLKKIAS